MAKINILSSSVYNRIAAGEVVDRPYSVVKELVENAIDADATEIEIYVEEGGKGLVRVVDNGTGIARDDLHSAFLPHATSKIARAEDLESILTLGFRGEAVASIASVSKMTILSKTAEGKCYALTSCGGEIGEIEERSEAFAHGSDVSVSELFFNAPVRLKFLKSDRAEEADITTFVARFILARPEIAFSYYVNGKSVLRSYGEGEEAAFACVYGAATLQKCYRIDADKHGVKIRGYIGNQNFTKSTRSYQTVFLNGRYVSNQTISAAVTGAYANYLMKRQYPFYVLHVEVPPEIVDVNVHPNKADVRFSDNKVVYGCIYRVISDVLDGNASALDYVVQTKENGVAANVADGRGESSERGENTVFAERKVAADVLSYEEARKAMREMSETPKKQEAYTEELPFDVPPERREERTQTSVQERLFEREETSDGRGLVRKAQNESGVAEEVGCEERREEANNANEVNKRESSLWDMFSDLRHGETKMHVNANAETGVSSAGNVGERNADVGESASASVNDCEVAKAEADEKEVVCEYAAERIERKPKEEENDFFAENRRLLLERDAQLKAKQQSVDVRAFVYKGKLFNTYLLYEHGDEVYIIDQHAAHERLIFNKLKEKTANRSAACQRTLVPYQMTLNAFESAFLRENLERIREMGFEIDEAEEGCFSVSGVPSDLTGMDVKAFFDDVLSGADGYRAIRLEELLRDKLASAACKAAVKGGDDLSQAEIDELFRLIDGNLGLRCPHGRPVVARMTRYELEKMFKRVV